MNIPHSLRSLRYAFSCMLLLALSACGGGGGGGSTSISTSPKSLQFEISRTGAPQTQRVDVQFKGDGVVVGYPPNTSPPGWLGIEQASPVSGGSVSFNLTAYPGTVAAGDYSVKVRFATGKLGADGDINNATDVSTTDITVKLSVSDFSLNYDAASYDQPEGATTYLQSSVALSTGKNSSWTVTSSQPWLILDRNSGTGTTEVTFSVSPGGLARGEYTGTLTFSDGKGQTAVFTAHLTISPLQLTASPVPVTISVGADNSAAGRSGTFTISDGLYSQVPARALSWSVQSIDVPWLSMSPTSGTTVPEAHPTVTVSSAALRNMANGTYTGNITLRYRSSDDSERSLQVPVQLALNSPLASIEVRKGTTTPIAQGTPLSLQAIGTLADGYQQDVTSQVTWTSSNTSVATVSNTAPSIGQVQPLLPGSTTVTAADAGSIRGSLGVEVKPPVAVAYVLNDYTGPKISQFVTGADGVLQPMAKGAVGNVWRPQSITFTADGRYAYVVNGDYIAPGQFGLSQFSVDSAGALTPLARPTVSLGSYTPTGLTVDSSGRYAYVTTCCSPESGVLLLSIGADGALTLDARPPIAAGQNNNTIAANPKAAFVYSPDFSRDQVNQYAIGAGGALTALPGALPATGANPISITVDAAGTHAYVANYSYSVSSGGTVSQYSVGADGALVPMSPPTVAAGKQPRQMVLAPSGKSAVMVYMNSEQATASGLVTYAIDAAGKLSLQYNYLSGYVRRAAFDPTGKFLYVTNGYANILQYTVGDDGTLVQGSSVVTTSDPSEIVVRKPPVVAP